MERHLQLDKHFKALKKAKSSRKKTIGSAFQKDILLSNIESMVKGKGYLPRILVMDEAAIEGKIDVDF